MRSSYLCHGLCPSDSNEGQWLALVPLDAVHPYLLASDSSQAAAAIAKG